MIRRQSDHTEIVYTVADEPHVLGYWKDEAAWFLPNRATAYLYDGELNDIKVWGAVIGKTGKLLASRTGYATYGPDEIRIGDAPYFVISIYKEVTKS